MPRLTIRGGLPAVSQTVRYHIEETQESHVRQNANSLTMLSCPEVLFTQASGRMSPAVSIGFGGPIGRMRPLTEGCGVSRPGRYGRRRNGPCCLAPGAKVGFFIKETSGKVLRGMPAVTVDICVEKILACKVKAFPRRFKEGLTENVFRPPVQPITIPTEADSQEMGKAKVGTNYALVTILVMHDGISYGGSWVPKTDTIPRPTHKAKRGHLTETLTVSQAHGRATRRCLVAIRSQSTISAYVAGRREHVG